MTRTTAPSKAAAADARVVPLGVPSRVLGGTFHIQSRRLVMLLCLGTLGLMSLCFPPVELWPLAYLCLVPWAVCVCTVVRSAWLYATSYLLGVAFFAVNVWWLYDVTGPGYAALCLWFALAFPLTAWPVRHLFRRFSAPAAITLPIVWTTFEYLRGQTLAGFPWFYLAHSHFGVPHMIQIADLTGAYGVTFVLAMVNGALTDLLIQPTVTLIGGRTRRSPRLPIGSALTALTVMATYFYGSVRLSETAASGAPGPRVAVLQQDFPYSVSRDVTKGIDFETMLESYLTLARQAATERPDLIVMPETAWPIELNKEFLESSADDLEAIRSRLFPRAILSQMETFRERCRLAERAVQRFTDESGIAVVIGAAATEWSGAKTPPRIERFNSAYLFVPHRKRDRVRYDKMHLVLFGEFVPFRYSSLHGVYEWLNNLTPWSANGFEYSLTFGDAHHTFALSAPSQQRTYRFATPICYEDVVADVIRPFVRGPTGEKAVDFLLSLSNDGWFNHSGELEQHLAAGVFRAVEYRVPIARAVNTGISAFIDSTGRAHDRVKLTTAQRTASASLDEGLASLARVADIAAARPSDARADQADVRMIADLIGRRVAPALETMAATAPASQPVSREGPRESEFDFLRQRLHNLLYEVSSKPAPDRLHAWKSLASQVAADRATLARWKRKPQTAPGYRVCQLMTDTRYSLYTQWGDWFPTGCMGLTGLMLADWLMHRLRRPSRRQRRKAAKRSGREAVA